MYCRPGVGKLLFRSAFYAQRPFPTATKSCGWPTPTTCLNKHFTVLCPKTIRWGKSAAMKLPGSQNPNRNLAYVLFRERQAPPSFIRQREKIMLPPASIAAPDAFGRHHDLPELVSSGAKAARAAKKVVFPHPVEPLSAFFLETGPFFFEVAMPLHQGPVVVGAEILPVFDDEYAFCRRRYGLGARQHGVGEDVLGDLRGCAVSGFWSCCHRWFAGERLRRLSGAIARPSCTCDSSWFPRARTCSPRECGRDCPRSSDFVLVARAGLGFYFGHGPTASFQRGLVLNSAAWIPGLRYMFQSGNSRKRRNPPVLSTPGVYTAPPGMTAAATIGPESGRC